MSFYALTKPLFNKYGVEKDVANLRGKSKGFSKAQKSGGGAPESKMMAKDTSEKDVHPQLRTCEIPSTGATLEMSLRPKLFLSHK